MVDRPIQGDVITLRNNRIIGWAASAVFVGTGSIFIIVSLIEWRGFIGIFLGAFLIVPGIWVIPAMTRPWTFDDDGVSRGTKRVLTWPEVTGVHVDDVRPLHAGMGPALVRLRIYGGVQKIDLTLYSYRDAVAVAQILETRLPLTTDGRWSIPRIPEAWRFLR